MRLSDQTIAFFGLGSMGYGMAATLIRAGATVFGFDVAPGPVGKLVGEGGHRAGVAQAGARADAAVIVVLNAAQLEAVLFGADGIAAHLRPGAVIIACPTIAPDQARALATRCEERGLHYLDAPISGGAAKAARGALSVMASGSAEAFAAAKPVLDTVAETVFDLGPEPGAGSAMKAINQMLAGVHIAAMAEAVTFGMTQGISAQKTLEVIPQCAGTSWMFENRAPHIVDGDYTPPFRRRYLAQGSRHRARDRARREILCTAHRRRPAAIPRRIGLRARSRGRCRRGQGLCAQCRAGSAG